MYEITSYILNHQDGIRSELEDRALEAETNPILKTFYREAVTDEVIQKICGALALSYEEVASVVTTDYLVEILGAEWFKL